MDMAFPLVSITVPLLIHLS